MKTLLRIFILMIFLLVIIGAFIFGQEITVTSQLKLFEELKSMAIALLTIVGIWLGVS